MDEAKINALGAAKEHRVKEILYHQINIDNYTLAIAKIDKEHSDDLSLAPFRAQLVDLLASAILEQKKEHIILSVIEQQLNAG